MPDYKIGSFRVAKGMAKGDAEVVYFATLPFAGSMAGVGRKGLFQIIAAIERQYADHQITNDLIWLRDWMEKLSAAARLFEQVRIDIEDDALRQALVVDALDEEKKRIMKDEEELEIFFLDRKTLDSSEDADLQAEDDTAPVNATVRTPGT